MGQSTVLAILGPDDICGETAFLEKRKATAAVVANEENVEVDEINANDLHALFEAFPGLASRFYLLLSMMLAQRLRVTSKERAQEMSGREAAAK